DFAAQLAQPARRIVRHLPEGEVSGRLADGAADIPNLVQHRPHRTEQAVKAKARDQRQDEQSSGTEAGRPARRQQEPAALSQSPDSEQRDGEQNRQTPGSPGCDERESSFHHSFHDPPPVVFATRQTAGSYRPFSPLPAGGGREMGEGPGV